MDPGLARRIVTPRDCVLALAVPTSEAAFSTSRELVRDGFASGFAGWEAYRAQLAKPAQRLLRAAGRLGAHIENNLTLAGFGELFERDFLVIILIAHWLDRGGVELADGFAAVESVVGQVPPDAARIIDFGICHPAPLVVALRSQRPTCLIRSTPTRKTTPGIWLYFYFLLMHQLRRRQTTYLEAIEQIKLELWKQIREQA